MLEVFKLLIGTCILILGVFIGKLMASLTKEELKEGQPYFKAITLMALAGGLIGLLIGNDVLLFTMFFIAIVTAQSVKKKKSKKNPKRKIRKKSKNK